MNITLGFGKKQLNLKVDEKNILDVLKPNPIQGDVDQVEEVQRALENPIGTKRLKEMVRPGEKVVIITSDVTRPMPTHVVLPSLLEELNSAGIKDEDIKVVFALGSHRKHTEEEKKRLVGEEIYSRIQCIDTDASDCIHMGETSNGTPVDIFREVALADRRICLGNIEYHYFAGYSGGAKAIMPGVSTRAAIQANHSKMVMEDARTGELDKNPVRWDIEEAISLMPIDFILNVVLDENKRIIKAVAGHFIEAHREGCRFLDGIYKKPIKELADIVIVSPGGYPKDINMYQAQKALDNAKHAVKDGGVIIWVASCTEGFGEGVFEEWINEAESPHSLVERIQRQFQLGGHKAAAIAMVLERCDVFLVSDLDERIVRKAFLTPYRDIDKALQDAYAKLGEQAKVLIMPYGGSTLPVLE